MVIPFTCDGSNEKKIENQRKGKNEITNWEYKLKWKEEEKRNRL